MRRRKLCNFFLIRIFIPLPFSRMIQETLKTSNHTILHFCLTWLSLKSFMSNNPDSSLKHSTNTMHFFFNFIQFKGLNSRDFLLMLCNLIWTAFPYTVQKNLFSLDSLVRCYNKSKPFRTYVWIIWLPRCIRDAIALDIEV